MMNLNVHAQVSVKRCHRRWRKEEDSVLLDYVSTCRVENKPVSYKEVSDILRKRSPKQCRERYENSLRTDLKRGKWSLDETLALVDLIIEHSQNWTKIREKLQHRTYNGIKKKGRKILGEILDRTCLAIGLRGKTVNKLWKEADVEQLIKLHREHRYSLDTLSYTMKLGRSEAELDRKLIEKCPCTTCIQKKKNIRLERGIFKDAWTRNKAKELKKRLLVHLETSPPKTIRSDHKCFKSRNVDASFRMNHTNTHMTSTNDSVVVPSTKKCPVSLQFQSLYTECEEIIFCDIPNRDVNLINSESQVGSEELQLLIDDFSHAAADVRTFAPTRAWIGLTGQKQK